MLSEDFKTESIKWLEQFNYHLMLTSGDYTYLLFNHKNSFYPNIICRYDEYDNHTVELTDYIVLDIKISAKLRWKDRKTEHYINLIAYYLEQCDLNKPDDIYRD